MRPNREIFTAFGEPQPDYIDKQKQENELNIRKDLAMHHPELGKILERIDMDVLNKIIMETATACGVDPERFSFVSKERFITSTEATGEYFPGKNLIAINYEKLKDITNKKKVFSEYLDLRILSTIVHEITHATSKSECYGSRRVDDGGYDAQFSVTGYERRAQGPQDQVKVPFRERGGLNADFRIFNEAVTEKLAREYIKKYLSLSHFDTEKKIDSYLELRNEHPETLPYSSAIKALELFIAKVAEYTGNSKEIVWQSIIRGYYEGEKFEDLEIEKFLEEIFAPGFLTALAEDLSSNELLESIANPSADSWWAQKE